MEEWKWRDRSVAERFETPEALKKAIDKYFQDCDREKRPYTMTGLAVALDTNRMTIWNYSHKDEYGPIINRAKQRCQMFAEEMLMSGKNPVGAIFNLKNNYEGWKEESITDIKGLSNLAGMIKEAQIIKHAKEVESGGNPRLPGADSE